MEYGSVGLSFVSDLLRISDRPALALMLLAPAAAVAQAQSQITVTGVVRDTSAASWPMPSVEALVGDRVIARATTGADGAYTLAVPARTPFALRTQRTGFADDVTGLDGAASNVSRDVTLSIGTLSDTLVVTASRGPESRTSVTQSLSVVGRADIQALGSTELSDVLRFVPGTSVEGTGREGGGPTSLFVSGGDSDYNVVLIDGVRANLDGGRFDFSRVAAGEIERVEVLRGAQSSLWGADAMTSVVQIITKRANPTERARGVRLGRRRFVQHVPRQRGCVRWRRHQDRLSRGGHESREPDGAFSDLLPEDDRYTQTAFDGGVGRRDWLVGIGARRTALQRRQRQGRRPGHLRRARHRDRVPDTRPDGLRYGLAHARIAVHWQRERQLLPLSRAIRRHDRRPVLHLCDPDWHAERALPEWHSARAPHRCRRVRHARSGRRAARPWTVPGLGTEL